MAHGTTMAGTKRHWWRLSGVAILSGFAVARLLSPAAGAADWATYRADIARSGVTDEGIDRDLHLRWTYQPAHPPRPAWPPPSEELPRVHVDNAHHVAIAGGVVYFGASVANKVYAVDAASGAVKWTYFAEGPVRFAPTVASGRLYFGSDDGVAYCLNAADGALMWKHRAGPSDERVLGNGRMISLWPVRTSLLVDGGLVHFAAGVFPYEGLYVCGLKAEDGSVVWRNDTIGDRAHELEYGGISPHGYLLASARILYVPSGRAMPAAFDRATGKFLFSASPKGKRGGTWALLDQNRLIAGVDHSGTPEKAAYDASTGEPQGAAFAWFNGVDMVVTEHVVYLVTRSGACAVDRPAYARAVEESDRLAAEQKALGAELAALKKRQTESPGQAGAEKIAEEMDALARKLGQVAAKQTELKDSVYLWRHDGKAFTSVIRAGDTVFVGGQGTVVGLDATSGQPVWQHAVDGRAVGLAVAGQKLVVSTDTGHVCCFGQGPAAAPKTLAVDHTPDPYPVDEWTTKYQDAARTIVEKTGVTKGYCLVLDCEEGRLAYELARQTELQIVGLEKDPGKRATARARLEAAGLLGGRVVVEPWDIETLPDYFANLIVSDRMLRTGEPTAAREEERYRVLRPWGGVAYLGSPAANGAADTRLVRGPLEGTGTWTQQYADPRNTACSGDTLVNGSLGILWYGEPGPQGMVERHGRAQAPVAMAGRLFVEGEELIMAIDAFNGTMLWRREIPGAVRVKVKADSGNLVLTETGLYAAALDKCYRLDPETGQTIRVYDMPTDGQKGPRRWGYVSVVGNVLYGSTAKAMAQEYGAILKGYLKDGQWRTPKDIPAAYKEAFEQFIREYPDPEDLRMAAQRSGLLYRLMTSFGTGGEFTQKNAVTETLMTSDRVFAIDTETGKLLWAHDGTRIANITVTLGGGQIFFADSAVTPAQRAQALDQQQRLMAAGTYKARQGILDELKEKQQLRVEYVARRQALIDTQSDHRELDYLLREVDYLIESLRAELYEKESSEGTLTDDDADVRMVVALDARTGAALWQKPVDLTGCGGDGMGAACSHDLLLFFGNQGNHDAWRFRAGGMKWRRITTLAADSGEMVWSRPLNYRTRPVIVDDQIILEPRACYLRTGETVMRDHPITGQKVPWEFLRPGHTCGVTAASADGLFYRSACTAFYDLARDRGVTIFGGYRPGCAISVIPACGLLLSPEASAGCTCSYPIRGTMALKRKDQRPQPWTVFVTPGDLRPVRHLAVNLGAFADMKDDAGTVWFAYPSPKTASYTHFPDYGVKLNLQEMILPEMGFFAHDFKNRAIAGTDKPWLFTSGCRGLLRCELSLIDAKAGQESGRYAVRLGFSAPAGDGVGQRVFDIKLQDKVVCEDCDIVQLANGPDTALVKDFTGVAVTDTLVLELVPKGNPPQETTAPVINFIEVRREGCADNLASAK